MWLPALVLFFTARGHVPNWVSQCKRLGAIINLNFSLQVANYIGGGWSHFQGTVSACATLMKPDILEAFLDMLPCCRRQPSSLNLRAGVYGRSTRISGPYGFATEHEELNQRYESSKIFETLASSRSSMMDTMNSSTVSKATVEGLKSNENLEAPSFVLEDEEEDGDLQEVDHRG